MSAPVLETCGLSKSFGGIDAVRDVSLSVTENEVCALIGPNGAGKSTFVGLVCGRITPTRGKVLFHGQDISTLPAHARIRLGVAYTFQITSVFTNLSVLENVSLAVRRAIASSNAGLKNRKRAVRERAMSALENVGLADSSVQTAGDLSYGHQRLLEIAMGLAQIYQLSFTARPGEVTCLLGRNGAGKSTTLKAIIGLLPLGAGSVFLHDTDIGSTPASATASQGIALVPQGRRLFGALSVSENLQIGLMARPNRSKAESRLAREKVLTLFPRLLERPSQHCVTIPLFYCSTSPPKGCNPQSHICCEM